MGLFKWVSFKFRHDSDRDEYRQDRIAGREKGAKKEKHKHEHWWSKTQRGGKHQEGWVGENFERTGQKQKDKKK